MNRALLIGCIVFGWLTFVGAMATAIEHASTQRQEQLRKQAPLPTCVIRPKVVL